ncbi:ABC transporter permease [Coprothermobacteraceae bacterium]|nr:ABC transporter permease [Coprothermobacteraceae bacterium]
MAYTFLFTIGTTTAAAVSAVLLAALYASSVSQPRLHLSFWRALSGIPPVLVGLLVYMLFSQAGPLGFLRWLFTPKALITAQFLLALPTALALALRERTSLPRDMEDFIRVNLPNKKHQAYLAHLKGTLPSTFFVTWGRILGEVGAATLSGGAIEGYTSTLATDILYKTNLGQFKEALVLGALLLVVSLIPSVFLELSSYGASGH